MYKIYYDLQELKKIINALLINGRKKIHLEQLLDEIGCDSLDVQEFYTKNIKHRIRYERH